MLKQTAKFLFAKSTRANCFRICWLVVGFWCGAVSVCSAQESTVIADLPRDLTPWGMYLAADWVVKSVMIGLLFASVVTWTVWLAKSIELLFAKRNARRALAILASARSLDDAAGELGKARGPFGAFVRAAIQELQLSADGMDREGIRSRIASRLERIEVGCGRSIIRGTGVLATIGSTAPFVGLFGTVWGIMNSFIGISKAQTTNLAVVAPGIAEALFATAIGLVAAIPATIFYNMYSNDAAKVQSRLENFADEFSAIISRQLDERA